MKKAIILFALSALLFSGCTNQTQTSYLSNEVKSNKISGTSNVEEFNMDEISLKEGELTNKDWENIEFPIEMDCIPDKEIAIKITKIFLENFQKQGYYVDYIIPKTVFYDTKGEIWIITFEESKDYPGACLSIAIRKKNAEVVKMWVGE